MSNNYDLRKAKSFIKDLHKKGWGFHFDDGAVESLYKNGICSYAKARRIDSNLDQIYEADLDWGKHGCPIGYLIYLEGF